MSQLGTSEKFEPNIVVLYCQHCVRADADMDEAAETVDGFKPRFVMKPCSSKVEASHVLKLLAKGADGVAVVGCPEDKCRFLIGSAMAEKRIEYARGLLDKVGMGADRLGIDRVHGLSSAELIELVEQRVEAVRPLGPNPMKGVSG
jgi:heterodisulfide reductase subunit D